MEAVGSKCWFIPDAFCPPVSNGIYLSHEAVCVLNPSSKNAEIKMTIYFEDREKKEGFLAECKAERTNHIRMDRIKNNLGIEIPKGIPYAIMVESSENIIVQYSRMDTTQAEMALMTAMAYSI